MANDDLKFPEIPQTLEGTHHAALTALECITQLGLAVKSSGETQKLQFEAITTLDDFLKTTMIRTRKLEERLELQKNVLHDQARRMAELELLVKRMREAK